MSRDHTSIDRAIRSTAADDIAFERLYGPWQPFTVEETAAALASYQRPWWVCGGVALEAFTKVGRHHDDALPR